MIKVFRRLSLCVVILLAGMSSVMAVNDGARVRSAGGDLVLVAGATGRTGQHVVTELLEQGYKVRAFVRDIEAAREKLGDEIEYAKGDVREPASIDAALDGVFAIVSSIGAGRGESGNGPEFVDYGGVKNLAEAAAKARLSQFVLVSSGGVTDEDHVLNKMFDNVLIWKFKGEEAVRASGVPYTIVRPGGLVDKPSNEAAITLEQGDEGTGMIPRADVAKVLVAALMYTDALNKTFEVISGDGGAPGGWRNRFAVLQPDE
jgi:uncharacterized protein YbjT (DUF2867 family)